MKKTLVALAALAATSAFAQSTVTITGTIDTGYKYVNASGAADSKGLVKDNTATSVITISGAEDLGNTTKANFQLQLTPDFINGTGVQSTTENGTTNGTVGNAQQAYVGLSNAKYGEIKLGRVNTNVLDAWGAGSVFGTALGSGYSTNGNILTQYSATGTATSHTAPTRFNGAIRYESPAFNGVSGSALFVPSGADTSQTVTDYGLKYVNGPLNVSYANQTIESLGTVAAGKQFIVGDPLAAGKTSKLSILSANYTIGAATVYASLFTMAHQSSTAVETKGRMIGAKYAMGATTLLASMATSDETTAANVDKKIAGIGADYAFSKRTNVYVRFENKDGDKNATTDKKVQTTAVGIKHTF